MSKSKRRLDRLELSLTPKQAVLLWMQEAHQYDTMAEYAQSLKPGPDSAWPMARLTEWTHFLPMFYYPSLKVSTNPG